MNSESLEVLKWYVEQLKKRLDYLKMIRERGYAVTQEEIDRLAAEIDQESRVIQASDGAV
jgi:hypothetical protein